jgi:hypothetical protein
VNAIQHLWATLATLLPEAQYQHLRQQYDADAARDQHHTHWRTWKRRETEALATIHAGTIEPLHPDTIRLAKQKLYRARTWLDAHPTWQPEAPQ